MWEQFGNWMGEGQNQDLFSVLAGSAGAAIGGPDTWQGRLGQTAAGLGQGNIMADEADKNKQQLMEMLTAALGGGQPAGGQPTGGQPPAGQPAAAPTSGLGDLTQAISGNFGVQPTSQQQGSLASPTGTQPQTQPTAPGGGQGPDPFYHRFFSR